MWGRHKRLTEHQSSILLEQVDIFWRRALFDSTGKIHCLLHGDMLSYDVSEEAQLHLDEYLQDIHHQKGNVE